MALINISTVLRHSLQTLAKIPPAGGIGLYSYKRNRKILVEKQATGKFLIHEDGYRISTGELHQDDLENELRSAVKREFPRSRKVRFYTFPNMTERDFNYRRI